MSLQEITKQPNEKVFMLLEQLAEQHRQPQSVDLDEVTRQSTVRDIIETIITRRDQFIYRNKDIILSDMAACAS